MGNYDWRFKVQGFRVKFSRLSEKRPVKSYEKLIVSDKLIRRFVVVLVLVLVLVLDVFESLSISRTRTTTRTI
jgi:hypothetical protein